MIQFIRPQRLFQGLSECYINRSLPAYQTVTNHDISIMSLLIQATVFVVCFVATSVRASQCGDCQSIHVSIIIAMVQYSHVARVHYTISAAPVLPRIMPPKTTYQQKFLPSSGDREQEQRHHEVHVRLLQQRRTRQTMGEHRTWHYGREESVWSLVSRLRGVRLGRRECRRVPRGNNGLPAE